MSKAKTRRQKTARAAFVATIADTAGQSFFGYPDGCEIGYTRSGDEFTVDRSAEHDPEVHTLGASIGR